MNKYQAKGSEMRVYALGIVVAVIASIFIPPATIIGIALALATISFLYGWMNHEDIEKT